MALVGSVLMAAIGVVMLIMTRRIAQGTFRRNPWAGIRLEATTRTEEGWQAAHRAALPWFRAAAVWCWIDALVLGLLIVVAAPEALVGGLYIGGFVGLAALVLVPVRRAIRAAEVANAAAGKPKPWPG